MEKETSSASLDMSVFENLQEKVDIIFRYNMLMDQYASLPRDYGLGTFMSEVDIHSLSFIEKEPGITAKEIARRTYRTKGTVSLMLSRLEADGFLEQKVNPNNQRERNLYLTPKGQFVCEQHAAYDRRVTIDYLSEVAKHCTPEEIEGYFKVTHYRTVYFEKELDAQKQAYAEYKKQHAEKK
ncbi:MAG: MarR family winged helix-turn-helix transcriptional regulator [Faecousia sp.]